MAWKLGGLYFISFFIYIFICWNVRGKMKKLTEKKYRGHDFGVLNGGYAMCEARSWLCIYGFRNKSSQRDVWASCLRCFLACPWLSSPCWFHPNSHLPSQQECLNLLLESLCSELFLLIRPKPHHYLQTVSCPLEHQCTTKPAYCGLWSIMDYSLMACVLSVQLRHPSLLWIVLGWLLS